MSQLSTIISKSKELFFRVGIKSVTMDDIARELGMSKKTLYIYVANKADLVDKTMIDHFDCEKEFIKLMEAKHLNAIDQIIEVVKHVLTMHRDMPLSAIHDLQKYYPKTWTHFNEFKDVVLFKTMKENIAQGKKEGLYRETIDENILAKFYVLAVEGSINPNNFDSNKINYEKIYTEYISYHLHGLATEKGINYLKTLSFYE